MRNDSMTYREIGDALGISDEMVRKIEKKALWKLKRSGKLEQFLDIIDKETKPNEGQYSEILNKWQ